MAGGLAVGGIGPLLDIFHYSDQSVKSGQIEPITDIGIKLMFCIIPILLLLFMVLSLQGYKLGKKEFGLLHKLLASYRDTETEAQLEPEAIQVGEQLTGAKSETFYGK
jgi:Na+/melibiose symporter-like transporter